MSCAIKRTSAIVFVILALAALSAPLAMARTDVMPATANNSGAAAAPFGPVASAPPQTTESSGFSWGDAGIGATAMLAMFGVGAGAVFVVRRNHAHQLPAS